MAFRLPPLNTLRLFEAAGRHLSFKLAAEELGVTPSAVSHGVQTIEDWLGTRLFVRSGRGLYLSDAGRAYLPSVQECLTILAAATDRVPGRRRRDQLVISVAPTFAARFLLPRLSSFQQVHPTIAVTIDTSHRRVEFPRDGIDLAIRIGAGNWPGLEAVELLREKLVPICSPQLRAKLGEHIDFSQAPLIHVTTISQDWPAWVEAAGLPPIDRKRGLNVDTLQIAFDAALRGLGIAIGRRPLIDAELDDGRLVTASDFTVDSATAYWLVGLPEAMQQPESLAFQKWLVDEIANATKSKRKPTESATTERGPS